MLRGRRHRTRGCTHVPPLRHEPRSCPDRASTTTRIVPRTKLRRGSASRSAHALRQRLIPFPSVSPIRRRVVPCRPRGVAGRPRANRPSRDRSMPNKMLIDTTHPEETRVVVLRGNRVEEFDFESANRKQLRGNIYLAKVTRVEPSLQAAFVDYGGNRHGFLAFSEIHPDYYQIPVADRQALIDEEERAQRAAEAEADARARRRAEREQPYERPSDTVASDPVDAPEREGAMAAGSDLMMPV